MLQQQTYYRQLVAHGSEHQWSGIELIRCTQFHQLRHASHYGLDGLAVTVECAVVDGCPAGMVIPEPYV